MMDCPLLGICLVGEVETKVTDIIGTVYMSSSTRAQTLADFRGSVYPFINSKPYVFLTASGWEISENLEDTVKVSDIVTSEGTVKIRIRYQPPRLGILLEGSPDIPLGFIFCNPETTIQQVSGKIDKQLPLLHHSLVTSGLCFLDRNGWPISKEQEGLLTVLEVAVSSAIRIRCASRAKLSQFHDHIHSLGHPEHALVARSSSTPCVEGSLSGSRAPAHASLVTEPVDQVDGSTFNQSLSMGIDFDSMKPPFLGTYMYEILISYVHNEASEYALHLKKALTRLGYSVFLDIHCIEGGTDWQDVLNDAISNCSLFIPLVTMQYGETLWTNREVKLADVMGKLMIPVSFVATWPPKCLAIQFATTQYISWNEVQPVNSEVDKELADSVAADIANRYEQELKSSMTRSSVNRQDTLLLEDSQITSPSELTSQSELTSPLQLTSPSQRMGISIKKKSNLKSYASLLPESLPSSYRKAIQESREGKPLVVFCCHPSQREFAQGLVKELERNGKEVWSSYDLVSSDEEQARLLFQKKVDEAGVVVFFLSKEFASSSFCEQQVYYCEQRKRIVPLIYEPMQLPNWMAMLIGTSIFVDCQAKSYKSTFLERVETALDPEKAQQELKETMRQKAEVDKMCSQLAARLPKGKHIYISGGTKFYSSCGEEICKELGRLLAQDPDLILVTGGFYGVGEIVSRSFFDERARMKCYHGICHLIAVRDDQDKSNQTRQNPDGTFPPVPYGDTVFFGDSVRQREMLTPQVVDTCILVEGGPGAAFETQQFAWNGNRVIPVKVTGGAAGGSFNVPQAIFSKPSNVCEADWALLSNSKATPTEIAAAIVRIVRTLKSVGGTPRPNNTASLKAKHQTQLQRSETVPSQPTKTSQRKRTFSEMNFKHSADNL